MALYADDLFLFLSNLSISLPNVLSILDTFELVSGYKVNYDKSELFPLNTTGHNFASQQFQFKVVTTKFTYLGIQIKDTFEIPLRASVAQTLNPCLLEPKSI